jgi:hypothetical protein
LAVVKQAAIVAVAAAVAAAVIVALLTGGRSPRQPVAGQEQFGANVNLLFNGAGVAGAQLDSQLQSLRSTGATIARSDALWEESEPAPPVDGAHHYRWAFDDRIAGALAAHGLRWLPIIDYSAVWAQSVPGRDHSPPSSDAAYAAYAAAVAARYGPGGTFWREHPALPALPVRQLEIWNEPDNAAFWVPAPDPGRYARLFAAARSAILAADPSALVLVGGLSSLPAFLTEMVAADPAVRADIDAVAVHPYGVTPSAVIDRVVEDRRALDVLGLASVPLYVTEFGWTTSPPGALGWAPASARPGYIEATLRALAGSGCGVAAAILYTWFSPRRDPADGQQWFGISASSADVAAFSAGVRAGARSRPSGSQCASASAL